MNAVEERLAEDPRDEAALRAYADWLSSQGDPLGARLRDGQSELDALAPMAEQGLVRIEWNRGLVERAWLHSPLMGPSLAPVLEALLALPVSRFMRALHIDLLSFVTERASEANKKPAVFRALTALAAQLVDAELPALRELKVGPLFSFSLPKQAHGMIRPKQAKRLATSESGFLEVFDEAWLEVLEAAADLAPLGYVAGQRIPLDPQIVNELQGRVLLPAGVYAAESPEELAGRPWKREVYDETRAGILAISWQPGWVINDARSLNGAPLRGTWVPVVPGDVIELSTAAMRVRLAAR